MTGADLRRRRLERGLTRRGLADRAGVTTAAIDHAEQTTTELAGALTDRLARALAQPGDRTPEPAPADHARVHALLADLAGPCTLDQIAEIFEWQLRRASDALKDLESRLAHSGQSIQRTGRGTYRLAPRAELLTETERRLAHQAPAGPLSPHAAAVLHQIIEGPRNRRYQDNFTTPAARRATERLRAADLIAEDQATSLWPTDRALATFGLNTTGHRQTSFRFQRTRLADSH